MAHLIDRILAEVDNAVNERWYEVGEVSDSTMARLRDLMNEYHEKGEGR